MSQSMIADLASSGLTPADIGARDAGAPEFAAIKVPPSSQGYVIPYYAPNGDRLPFYRIKLFGQELKYKQAHGTANHVYFPKNFKATLDYFLTQCKQDDIKPFIILTEGEKKAAATCKHGIPCCALGGVDNWRNRTIILPPETELKQGKEKGVVRAKLPSGFDAFLEDFALALGMQQLSDALVKAKIPIIIIYDTDEKDGLKMEVQRAASQLAHQFLYMGIPISKVRQAILPYEGKKVGLDDYLLEYPKEDLIKLCHDAIESRHTFPRHPNPRALINGKLQKGKLNRKEIQEIALTVLAELDGRGRRLLSTSSNLPYYFDETTHSLMAARMIQKQNEPIHETPFGKFLYRQFGLSSADSRVLGWLAAMFTGEDPIEDVEPRRIMAIPPTNPDEIALQISDSHFVVISGDLKKPLKIFTNGQYGLLFEQEQVEGTKAAELEEEFHKQLSMEPECWWLDIFRNSVNLNDNGDENVAKMAALLYYISPWLLRWRGTQLPIELIIGEAGSGKSSLFELRLSIITGEPHLRNIPSDLKDWFASIVNTGGLHVIDNVQFTNKELRQRLSDEMCRIITEPKPHIEMRRLYSTTGQYRLPVNTVFAMTAIQQPFYNADIIQRSAIFELGAIGGGHDSNWVGTQLDRFGGRTSWLAHHLVFIHRFLHRVQEGGWKDTYKAEHRLGNYEQCLQVAAQVFGIEYQWIAHSLLERTQKKITEADWTLEGLKEYAAEVLAGAPDKKTTFAAVDIAQWAEAHEEHFINSQLINPRSLGRYLTSHQVTVQKVVGISPAGTKNNRKIFSVGPSK